MSEVRVDRVGLDHARVRRSCSSRAPTSRDRDRRSNGFCFRSLPHALLHSFSRTVTLDEGSKHCTRQSATSCSPHPFELQQVGLQRSRARGRPPPPLAAAVNRSGTHARLRDVRPPREEPLI